jgi:hypothetical protein
MTQVELDLTRNLTEKRIPFELQDKQEYRLIIWEMDMDTGCKMIVDIAEGYGKFAFFYFNKTREQWLRQGYKVALSDEV